MVNCLTMPLCSNCSKAQSKLNKGALCKSCFNSGDNNNKCYSDDEYVTKDEFINSAQVSEDEIISDIASEEREFIDVIKERMLQEKDDHRELQINYIASLKEQITCPRKDHDLLNNDIIHKNEIIASLLFQIRGANPYSGDSTPSSECSEASINAIINKTEEIFTPSPLRECLFSTSQKALLPSQGRNKDLLPPRTPPLNRSRHSTVDDDSNTEKEVGSKVPPHKIKQHPIPIGYISNKRPLNVINMHPEEDNQIYSSRTVPGNSFDPDITKKGRKLCIYADSIVKKVDMVNFSEDCKHKMSLKRAFPGCTASQLKHWIKPSLEEDTPDIAITHVGTNNLTKKKQSEVDTVNEIIEVIKECRNGGVNEIYVSGLICRPLYQDKINAINRLLSIYADKYDYYYIDNSNIKQLWKEQFAS